MTKALRLSVLRVLVLAAHFTAGFAFASDRPCVYADVHPVYPPADAPPIARAIEIDDGVAGPVGAECFPSRDRAATWITVSSVIHIVASRDQLIQRFGAISQLVGVPYWSTTQRTWRPMISAAFAVDLADSVKRRADYSVSELSTGTSHYYRVTDTRTYNDINYRLQFRPSSPDEIVVETTNVDRIEKWGLTLYNVDGLHTLYFLNERSPGVWAYYSITRAAAETFLAKGHDRSYVNRAVALFQYYMGLPLTGDPPSERE